MDVGAQQFAVCSEFLSQTEMSQAQISGYRISDRKLRNILELLTGPVPADPHGAVGYAALKLPDQSPGQKGIFLEQHPRLIWGEVEIYWQK